MHELKDDLAGDQILDNLASRAEIPSRERKKLIAFLRKYKKVFSLHGELRRYDWLPFSINTENAGPICQMPCRVHSFYIRTSRI